MNDRDSARARARAPIERHLRPAYDERRIAATWNRIAGARQRPRARATRSWMVAAVCVVAAVIVVAWPRSSGVRPLASRDPSISLAPGAVWVGRDVVLDDDSTIALAADARLQVLTNDAAGFSTLLEAGSARFDVRPGGPRRWEIETGVATVDVVGTAFAMTLESGRLEVEVTRGVVMVHGERVPGRIVRLTAGQRIVVGQAPVTQAAAPAPVPVPMTAPPTASRPPQVMTQRPPPEHPVESLAAIMAEADRLSSTGDPEGAARLLERVRGSRAPSSGLASFTLGRLYLDVLGRPELAAAAFGDVIDRGDPRSLIEDAYARRVEALIRAGQRERAGAALTDYERAFPHGRRIATLRAMMRAP